MSQTHVKRFVRILGKVLEVITPHRVIAHSGPQEVSSKRGGAAPMLHAAGGITHYRPPRGPLRIFGMESLLSVEYKSGSLPVILDRDHAPLHSAPRRRRHDAMRCDEPGSDSAGKTSRGQQHGAIMALTPTPNSLHLFSWTEKFLSQGAQSSQKEYRVSGPSITFTKRLFELPSNNFITTENDHRNVFQICRCS